MASWRRYSVVLFSECAQVRAGFCESSFLHSLQRILDNILEDKISQVNYFKISLLHPTDIDSMTYVQIKVSCRSVVLVRLW